jgi:hypothetical protein
MDPGTGGVGDGVGLGDGELVTVAPAVEVGGEEEDDEPPQAATDKAAATISPARSLRAMLLIAER